MIVRALSLVDFRNYASADVTFEPGPNLVVGRNGQGKTNLVEAIGYLASLSSHRVSTDQALIRHGADAAVVRARLEHDGRSVLIELQLNRGGANRAQVNGAPAKPRDLPRSVSSVLFAPEDLALVRGEPAGRRRFLDQLLVQLSPRMSAVLADYDRALRQRNTLLKSARGARIGADGLGTLDLWDERLVDFGSHIIHARADLTELLRPHAAAAYERIAGAGHSADLASELSILGSQPEDESPAQARGTHGALSREATATVFREALQRVRRSELERGLTLVGPHRDDLLLELNGLPARGYASHGESWSFALALKLAAAQLLRDRSSRGDPIIVLDDVFAELDEGRRGQLSEAIAGFEQVLITAAVRADVPDALAGNTVWIEAGRVVDGAPAGEPR